MGVLHGAAHSDRSRSGSSAQLVECERERERERERGRISGSREDMAGAYGAVDAGVGDVETAGLITGREATPAPSGWSRKAKACVLVLAMVGATLATKNVNFSSTSTATTR